MEFNEDGDVDLHFGDLSSPSLVDLISSSRVAPGTFIPLINTTGPHGSTYSALGRKEDSKVRRFIYYPDYINCA
jgi:hypothetical protein